MANLFVLNTVEWSNIISSRVGAKSICRTNILPLQGYFTHSEVISITFNLPITDAGFHPTCSPHLLMMKFHEGISLSGTRACRCKIYNQNIQHTRVQKCPRDNIYDEFIQKSQIFMHFVSLSTPPPSIPKRYIGFISLSFVTPKIYGFHFPQPKNMWVSLCSKLNTQNVPAPLYTKTLYWFCFPRLWHSQNLLVSFWNFPQPHSPTICEFPFPQP